MSKSLFRFVYKLKGSDKPVLVADTMRTSDMHDGPYYLERLKGGKARLS